VVGFGLALPSVAASHLLLNLREAYYHPNGATTGGASRTHDLPTFNHGNQAYASGGRYRTQKIGEFDTQWALDSAQDGVTVQSQNDVEANIARGHTLSEMLDRAQALRNAQDAKTDGQPGAARDGAVVSAPKFVSHLANVGTIASSTASTIREGDEVTDEVYELDHVPSRLHTRVQDNQNSSTVSQ
jgi:hypothetical protein